MKKRWVLSAALVTSLMSQSCVPERAAHAETIAAAPAHRPDPVVENEAAPSLDHGRLIAEARGLLDEHEGRCEKLKARKPTKKHARKSKRAVRCVDNPVVAVVHPENGRIELIKAGKEFSVSRDAVIQTGNANGVNTEYAPVYPQGLTVLAVKRSINERRKGWRDVIYTPYSPSLNVPEVRGKGLEYLTSVVTQAQKTLRDRRVKSQAFRGALVSDVAPAELAMALALNEHMDPNRYTRGEAARTLVDEVLTVLGTNQRGAYRYAVSSDGARGLWQFMRGTYDALRKQYPRARLHKDFVQGTDDHLNAAMACLLLLDADLAVLETQDRDRLRRDPDEMGRFLAATYNGGAPAVEAAWDVATPFWTESLEAQETRIYVEKFEAIRRLLRGQDGVVTSANGPAPIKG